MREGAKGRGGHGVEGEVPVVGIVNLGGLEFHAGVQSASLVQLHCQAELVGAGGGYIRRKVLHYSEPEEVQVHLGAAEGSGWVGVFLLSQELYQFGVGDVCAEMVDQRVYLSIVGTGLEEETVGPAIPILEGLIRLLSG